MNVDQVDEGYDPGFLPLLERYIGLMGFKRRRPTFKPHNPNENASGPDENDDIDWLVM
ncbi:MAG: hypothetical protein ACOYW4_01785 [Bacillota bacterium]